MGKAKRDLEEAQAEALRSELDGWWRYAQEISRLLANNGQLPPHPTIYGPVLRADERVRLATHAGYARLYAAGDGSWSVPGYAVAGNTSLMLGAAVGHRIAISRAKADAAAAAQIRWREHQTVHVVVTDRRILCNVARRGWLDFWFDAVNEFYPSLENWSLTMGFTGDAGPLLLQGPAVAGVMPWVAKAVLGERWISDPRLEPLVR